MRSASHHRFEQLLQRAATRTNTSEPLLGHPFTWPVATGSRVIFKLPALFCTLSSLAEINQPRYKTPLRYVPQLTFITLSEQRAACNLYRR